MFVSLLASLISVAGAATATYPSKAVRLTILFAPGGPSDNLGQSVVADNRGAADGNDVVASTPEEFAAFLRAETGKWAKVAVAAGIKSE